MTSKAAPPNSGERSADLVAYLQRINPPESAALAALRRHTAALPFVAPMQGAPAVGHLLRFLIGVTDARAVLEVGVFTGCSTLAMAEALPADGRIVAIDANEKWTAIGKEFWVRSGCANRIDLRIGQATDLLDAMIHDGLAGTIDLAFIDTDKDAYDACFDRSLVLLRQNGLMVFDNVLFGGLTPGATAAEIRQQHVREPRFLQDMYVRFAESLRRFNERMAGDPRVDAIVLPMMDGVMLVRKR